MSAAWRSPREIRTAMRRPHPAACTPAYPQACRRAHTHLGLPKHRGTADGLRSMRHKPHVVIVIGAYRTRLDERRKRALRGDVHMPPAEPQLGRNRALEPKQICLSLTDRRQEE